VVEKANHGAAQRWWRTLADEHTFTGAQADLDRFCVRVGDARVRRRDGAKLTVAELAAAEPLLATPAAPYPAVLEVTRTVSAQALVGFRGNQYLVGPGSWWPDTAAPRTAPAPWCAPTPTSPRWNGRCWQGSPTGRRAEPRPGAHRARPRGPRPPGCAANPTLLPTPGR
jgi:hypothetical protein